MLRKNYRGILFVILSILMVSCSQEEDIDNVEVINEVVIDKQDEFIGLSAINEYVSRVSEEYVQNLFGKNSIDKNSKFVNDVLDLSVDINSIEYIDLLDIEADMLTLEAETRYENVYSDVTILNINNEEIAVVSHFKVQNFDGPNGEYNGWQFFTNLEGIIIEAYLYEDGLVIGQANSEDFFDNHTPSTSKVQSKYVSGIPDPTPCWGIGCGITLDEVVIQWTIPNGTGIVNINQRRSQWTVGENPNNRWTGYAAGYMTYLNYQNEQKAWTINDEVVIEAEPGDEIKDANDYTKCFNTSSNSEITIYIDQPKANSSETWVDDDSSIFGVDINVGHTFVAITQGDITRVFGFYPKTDVSPRNPSTGSVLIDDSGHNYDVSITRTISGSQLASILSIVNGYNSTYDLNTYNCTDFGMACGNAAGMGLPNSYGSWPVGGGDNPGVLGENVRNLRSSNSTIDKNGGKAKSNKGGC